jgi:ferrous iron transport protein A
MTAVLLAELPAGTRAVVRSLRGGRDVANRLGAMGLVAGAGIEVLQNPRHGPLLVLVRDTRIALGRGEAAKILVEAAP